MVDTVVNDSPHYKREGVGAVTLEGNYSVRAMRTNNENAGTYGTDNALIHAALGLSDETCEIVMALDNYTSDPGGQTHAALVGEIGDAFWFLALCCHSDPIRGKLEDLYDSVSSYRSKRGLFGVVKRDLMYATKNLVGYVKKGYAFGVDLDPGTMEMNVAVYLGCLVDLCDLLGITPSAAQRANIEKLTARFPHAFTEEDAVNRDYAAEASSIHKELGND